MFVLFSLVLILGSCRHAAAYVNALDAEFSFSCGTSEQTISHVESVHDNHAEDRQFDFSCRDVMAEMDGTKAACYWTGYANVFDQPENFQCPGNQYVNGMGSQHNNHYEDRIWKFRCCSLPDVHMADCKFTDWTNAFDGAQNFNAEPGTVMKGMDSYHSNHNEDRRYKFELCTPFIASGSLVGK
ncbi:dermatopontin-like [Mya arenaria]|uniref:dermatopontin-like n=1 Tax=Mya arenaria TaxID=6604 RepID=UPI0022E3EFC5|nr:dermatopontin-like [Mya arenaria]